MIPPAVPHIKATAIRAQTQIEIVLPVFDLEGAGAGAPAVNAGCALCMGACFMFLPQLLQKVSFSLVILALQKGQFILSLLCVIILLYCSTAEIFVNRFKLRFIYFMLYFEN